MEHVEMSETVPLPIVDQIWCHPNDVPSHLWHKAYGTCKRYDKAHCINSNILRIIAKLLGRKVTFLMTYKGKVHWTEEIDSGEKYKFVMPLKLSYAKMLDIYDERGEHFRAPTKPPFGPVECIGPASQSNGKPKKEKKSRARLHVDGGKVKSGVRPRENQAPWVSV
jgi:hypothetical protein